MEAGFGLKTKGDQELIGVGRDFCIDDYTDKYRELSSIAVGSNKAAIRQHNWFVDDCDWQQ